MLPEDEEESVIKGGLLDSLLQEDIFFEIAENFQDDEFEFDGLDKKEVPKYENSVMVLNGVEKRLIENIPGHVNR